MQRDVDSTSADSVVSAVEIRFFRLSFLQLPLFPPRTRAIELRESGKLADQRPTHVRWHILAILTAVMVVTALGRLNLGIAGKYLQDDFRFTTQTMGWILGAFAFGYAVFQVPCGWAGDRFGPRTTRDDAAKREPMATSECPEINGATSGISADRWVDRSTSM